MRTTPIPNPLPGPSPRIRSWRVSRASHNAPRPPKPHNLSHEPLLQDTSVLLRGINIETLDLRQLCTILRAQTGNDRDTLVPFFEGANRCWFCPDSCRKVKGVCS